MSTGEQMRSAASHFENRLEFETLLSDLSSRFINLSPGDVDREIEDALRRVCEFLEIDLAVLWQWLDSSSGVITPTHAYCADEKWRPSEPMSQEQYPWAREQMLAGHAFAFSSVDELPAEAAVDRETCRAVGIKSSCVFPLSVGGERPVGALGFNAIAVARDWPDELVNRLQLVAQVFTNALARKRRETALRANEARLAAGAQLADLAFYEVDFGEGSAWIDDRFREAFGVPADQQEGLRAVEFWSEHLHPDDRERVLDLRAKLDDGRLEQVSTDYRFLHPARGERWFHHIARATERDTTGRALRCIGALRDVTEEKRSGDELRDLSRRLIRAHEEERAILARELHDDVTQRLAVLAIDVGRAELTALGKEQGETMRAVRDGLIRISEDIHSLAYHLHPSVLVELGLVEALRAECERFGRRSGTELAVSLAPLPAAIGNEAALCLFRVAQEALNNVARHSGAPTASVTLRPMDNGLLLAVHDDGSGFERTHPKGNHLGLASMRERVRLVNGTLDVESAPGHGTTIVAWVPVEGESA